MYDLYISRGDQKEDFFFFFILQRNNWLKLGFKRPVEGRSQPCAGSTPAHSHGLQRSRKGKLRVLAAVAWQGHMSQAPVAGRWEWRRWCTQLQTLQGEVTNTQMAPERVVWYCHGKQLFFCSFLKILVPFLSFYHVRNLFFLVALYINATDFTWPTVPELHAFALSHCATERSPNSCWYLLQPTLPNHTDIFRT